MPLPPVMQFGGASKLQGTDSAIFILLGNLDFGMKPLS
jgi:hypothetical protein